MTLSIQSLDSPDEVCPRKRAGVSTRCERLTNTIPGTRDGGLGKLAAHLVSAMDATTALVDAPAV